MCGIVGIVNRHSKRVPVSMLHKMSSYLKERGPEHRGDYVEGAVGLGHTRLSIIDLDARSHQPMLVSDNSIVITYNGEIYNFRFLKKQLQQEGVSFTTTSDTEVLLKGYRAWGMDKLLRLVRGMFAFAIWDKRKEKFYLSRDFFGKKPLYYYRDDESFLFSSDIRSIWSQRKEKLSIDYESVDYYLSEISMPQPKTIWKEVKQLAPASYLELDLAKWGGKLREYLKLKPQPIQDISLPEAIEETEVRVKEAIKRRLIADVPIGCFLSGGVDSGLVVALLAQQSPEPVKTFSVGLSHGAMNELPEAKIVAERYQTEHQEIILEPNVLEILPNLIDYFGEPFADASMIPSFYVTQAISKTLKVALSGDGGDELFGGYDDYGLAYRSGEYLKSYPNRTVRSVRTWLDKIVNRFDSRKENMGAYAAYLRKTPAQKLFRDVGFPFERTDLYFEDSPLWKTSFIGPYLDDLWELSEQNSNENVVDVLMRSSLKTRLLNSYLVKVDRMAMLNSLEVRSPFLDFDLAEWAFSLPADLKFNQTTNKLLLKKLAVKHVDANMLNRPKKGFGIPVYRWLREEMYDWMRDILSPEQLKKRGLFNVSSVQRLIKEHREGKTNQHTNKLWALICLELWFQSFIDE